MKLVSSLIRIFVGSGIVVAVFLSHQRVVSRVRIGGVLNLFGFEVTSGQDGNTFAFVVLGALGSWIFVRGVLGLCRSKRLQTQTTGGTNDSPR